MHCFWIGELIESWHLLSGGRVGNSRKKQYGTAKQYASPYHCLSPTTTSHYTPDTQQPY